MIRLRSHMLHEETGRPGLRAIGIEQFISRQKRIHAYKRRKSPREIEPLEFLSVISMITISGLKSLINISAADIIGLAADIQNRFIINKIS